MEQYIPCRLCATKPGPERGFFYVEQDGAKFVKECDCHKKWVAERQLQRELLRSNVWRTAYTPSSYVGTKSRDNIAMLQAYIERFEERFSDKSVYFYGTNGTQKTTLAMWVAAELIKKGVVVYYTLMETLSTALLPDFGDDTSAKDTIVDLATAADLLIIDEAFDRRKQTLFKSGYNIPFIDRFLRQRIDVEKKAIIFISNNEPTQIEEQGFGRSLQSLIVRNVRESLLTFEDVYVDNCNVVDSKGLFR